MKRLIQTLVAWGPLGLFLLAVADSAGVPVVGGVDLLLVTVAARDPQQGYIAAIFAIAGSVLGSMILFGIARKGGDVFLAKYTAKGTGKRLHAWFAQYGLITVFVPAISPLPMPMKIPVFCAGALGVRWWAFITVVVIARTIRYLALAFLARRYGAATFVFLRQHGVAVALVALSLALAAILALRLVQRQTRQSF